MRTTKSGSQRPAFRREIYNKRVKSGREKWQLILPVDYEVIIPEDEFQIKSVDIVFIMKQCPF